MQAFLASCGLGWRNVRRQSQKSMTWFGCSCMITSLARRMQYSPHRNYYRTETYTQKVFSALKTQVPQQAKKRFGVYQKACFQGKKKENAYTPKSLQGACWGPLDAILLYRFWPPITTELTLERAGPVILKTGFLELIAFRLIPVICPTRRAKPEILLEMKLSSQTGPILQ